MFRELITRLHSMIWWIDWITIVILGIFFDTVVWPGNRAMYRKSELFWAWTLMKIGGIRLEITGREHLPKNETVVYMANHQSDLDWPIMFMAIPGQYLFLAKKELFDAPIFGTYMKIQNYIPIERESIQRSFKTYQGVVDLIKQGNSVVIFPEGTRSYDKELQRFKSFSFAFLQEARVRVVPVAIDGSVDIQKKGSRLIRPGKVKVTIMPPVSFDDVYHLENKEFCAEASSRVRQALLSALEEGQAVPKTGGKSAVLKRLFTLFLCLLMSGVSGRCSADEEKVTRMAYVCRDLAGNVRWKADTEIKHIKKDLYVMVEKAKGIYSSFKGPVSWAAKLEYRRTGDNIRLVRMEKRVFDAGMRMIRHELQEFDPSGNSVTCTHEEPLAKISRTKKFILNKTVVNRLSLGLYAQKFLETGKTREKLQMVSEEPNVYEIELYVADKDMIDVNGRRRSAYRLCVDPSLGAFNFVKVLLPKAYAWHSDVPAYEWLRYAGLEGGITSAKVVVTVTDQGQKEGS